MEGPSQGKAWSLRNFKKNLTGLEKTPRSQKSFLNGNRKYSYFFLLANTTTLNQRTQTKIKIKIRILPWHETFQCYECEKKKQISYFSAEDGIKPQDVSKNTLYKITMPTRKKFDTEIFIFKLSLEMSTFPLEKRELKRFWKAVRWKGRGDLLPVIHGHWNTQLRRKGTTGTVTEARKSSTYFSSKTAKTKHWASCPEFFQSLRVNSSFI